MFRGLKMRCVVDCWVYLKNHKRYWLLPVLLMTIFFCLLVLFVALLTETPFVYTLF